MPEVRLSPCDFSQNSAEGAKPDEHGTVGAAYTGAGPARQ
jgi:hypothetical protein